MTYGETATGYQTLSLDTEDTWYQFEEASWTVVQSSGMTGDTTSGSLTSTVSFAVPVMIAVFVTAVTGSGDFQLAVFKNGSLMNYMIAENSDPTGFPISVGGLDIMNEGDVYDLRVRCTSGGSAAYEIYRAYLNVFAVGSA